MRNREVPPSFAEPDDRWLRSGIDRCCGNTRQSARKKRHSMTILEKLRADHGESVALLATIMAAGDEQQRNTLFGQFLREFTAQTKAEKKEFYEILRTYEDSRYISLCAQQARDLALSLANKLAVEQHKATELWTAQCQVLKTMLEQHIREEERAIFPLAKEIFDKGTLRRMGSEFSETKRKYLR
jgi:hemerythrin-like domain-containing protein